MENELIPCECCSSRVELARSVMLRGDPREAESIIPDRFKNNAYLRKRPEWPPGEQELLDRLYAQYKRSTEYRRAFICNACFTTLDASTIGVAAVITPEGSKTYNLSGSSRGDRAAVVNVAKYQKYQAKLWGKITGG